MVTRRLPPATAALAAALVALAGCTREDVAARTARADSVRVANPALGTTATFATGPVSLTEPTEVTIKAHDYYFDGPLDIPAGVTTFHLINTGDDIHHMQLYRLTDGRSAGDYLQSVNAGERQPAWAVDAGGANTTQPGTTSNATLMLEPGEYVVTCTVVGQDGETHAHKGMAQPLTVSLKGARPARVPSADLTMRLVDYGYDLPRAVTPGRHVINVTNAGEQPHEVLLVRLAAGKTAQDYVRWYGRQQGTAPGELLGGISSIAPGAEATVTADFEPGDYALLCLVPDAKDGKPHVMHGMVRQLRVG